MEKAKVNVLTAVILALAVLLSFSACSGEAGETGSSETESNQSFTTESQQDVASGDMHNAVIYYVANGGDTSLEKKAVSFSGEPAELIKALIENGALPGEAKLNSFHREGKIGWIDMNQSYGDAVGMGTYTEWLYISTAVNSFLESYDLEKLLITVDGKVLETGHYGSFDSLLGYQND